jgi:type I restriction enzyme, S subunit
VNWVPFDSLFLVPQKNGLTRPKAVRGAGTKMVNMGELFAYDRLRNVHMERVPLSEQERSFLLEPGDLLFARQSLVREGAGRCVIFQGDQEDVTFESHIIRVRLENTRAIPAFYYYWFRSPQGRHAIDAIINQVAAAGIRGSDLARVPVPCPPAAKQAALTGVLGALDDKIELSRRMNETLEAMARALFKSWFIDFDPVRAKMTGRAPGSMDAATAALFPDSVADSVLGPIPRGWQVTPLGEVLELKRGYDLPTAHRRPGAVPIISSSGPSGYHDVAKVRGPGVVTGRYGTIGRVFHIWEDFWPLNTALYVRDFKESDPLYALHLVRCLDFDKFSDKGAVPGINRNHLHMEPVCKAPAPVQRRFGEQIHAWLSLVRAHESQSETLMSMRDALLPRLLCGDLRVRDSEREVGELA